MSQNPDSSLLDARTLLDRVRDGDQDAWEELVRRNYEKVRRVVARRLNPPMRSLFDSTDFTNDVFTSLVAKFDRFDFPDMESLLAYLNKAATRKVIDEHRRMHRLKWDVSRERRLSGAEEGLDVAGREPTPSQVAQAEEAREWLLGAASDPQRAIVEAKSEGDSNEEVARKTGHHPRKVQRILKKLHDSWHAATRRHP